jgi:hypothetical protein
MTAKIFHCPVCKVTYSVSEKDPDLRLLKTAVPCPNNHCKGRIKEFASTNANIKAVKVKAIELYQANQMGFKKERKCGPKDLSKVLAGATIKSIEVDSSNTPDRALLRSITLENGKTLHLGPSTLGVVVTKITENRDVR